MIQLLNVLLFGRAIGVLRERADGVCDFQYTPEFCDSGVQPSPLQMPAVPGTVYSFPSLERKTFYGLPGMMADSLPDSFGQTLLNQWLTAHGRNEFEANALEKLSFQGTRCMGALEYQPSRQTNMEESSRIELEDIVESARQVLASKEGFVTCLENKEKAVLDILKIGTSAGGQRAKAVIALNDATGEILSGQVKAPEGFDYWIVKFDGFDSDAKPVEPANYGRREYAFSQCIKDSGIDMTECRLVEENGRAHFMTKRFDRIGGGKLHVQTLCGLAHYDYNYPGAYSYEQAFATMRRLGLTYAEAEELYRRMVFNVLCLNMDDHTKNISFLMNRKGQWSLAPAYDMGFNYNPAGAWTNAHQMTVNSKRSGISKSDLLEVARKNGIKAPGSLIEQVKQGVMMFPHYAKESGVPAEEIKHIMNHINEEMKRL